MLICLGSSTKAVGWTHSYTTSCLAIAMSNSSSLFSQGYAEHHGCFSVALYAMQQIPRPTGAPKDQSMNRFNAHRCYVRVIGVCLSLAEPYGRSWLIGVRRQRGYAHASKLGGVNEKQSSLGISHLRQRMNNGKSKNTFSFTVNSRANSSHHRRPPIYM